MLLGDFHLYNVVEYDSWVPHTRMFRAKTSTWAEILTFYNQFLHLEGQTPVGLEPTMKDPLLKSVLNMKHQG